MDKYGTSFATGIQLSPSGEIKVAFNSKYVPYRRLAAMLEGLLLANDLLGLEENSLLRTA